MSTLIFVFLSSAFSVHILCSRFTTLVEFTMYQKLQRSVSMQSDLDPLYSDYDIRPRKRLRSTLAIIFAVVVGVFVVVTLIVVAVKYHKDKKSKSGPHHNHQQHPRIPHAVTECGEVRGMFKGQAYQFLVRLCLWSYLHCHKLSVLFSVTVGFIRMYGIVKYTVASVSLVWLSSGVLSGQCRDCSSHSPFCQ